MEGKKGVVISHVVVKGSRDRRQGELWSLLREIVIGHEVMEWGFMMKGVVVVIARVVLTVLALWAGFVMCNSLQHIMQPPCLSFIQSSMWSSFSKLQKTPFWLRRLIHHCHWRW